MFFKAVPEYWNRVRRVNVATERLFQTKGRKAIGERTHRIVGRLDKATGRLRARGAARIGPTHPAYVSLKKLRILRRKAARAKLGI